jgi:hypothetical protein
MQNRYTLLTLSFVLMAAQVSFSQIRSINKTPHPVKYQVPWSVIPNNTTGCDTAGWPIPAALDVTYYTYNNGAGFLTGNNQYGDKEKAVFLNLSSTPNTKLIKVIAGLAEADGANLTKVVKFKVYDGTDGTPGAQIGSTIDLTLH